MTGATTNLKVATEPQLPASIAENAAEIKKLAASIVEDRTKSETLLKSALDHYGQAADAAAKYSTELTTKVNSPGGAKMAEAVAWKGGLAIYNPSSIRLQQAGVQLLLARLYRTTASEHAGRAAALKLTEQVVRDASLAGVPADLKDDTFADGGQGARDAATAAQEEAKKLIDDAEQATAPAGSEDAVNADKKAAHVRRLVVMLSDAAVTGITPSLDEADHKKALEASADKLKQAKDRASAADSAVAAADLPGVLQDTLSLREAPTLSGVAAGGGATTGPTTGPAAGPAEPDSPEAAAARAAAVAYMDALAAKDIDKAKSLAEFTPPQDQYIEAEAAVASAYKPFKDALTGKFGSDPAVAAALAAMPDVAALVRSVPVVVAGDTATLTPPGGSAGDAITVKKQAADGTWKVSITKTVEQITREGPLMRATAAAFEKVTAGIAANTYATAADALKDAMPASVLDAGAGETPAPTPPAPPAPTDGATPAPPAPPAPTDGATPAPTDPATPAPTDPATPAAPAPTDPAAPAAPTDGAMPAQQ